MQYINLNKCLEMENKILDLLLISIDDQIDTIEDRDGAKISGKISIGGKAKTLEGDKEFNDSIDIDIFLTYDEIVDRNSLNISINDFNYKLEDSKLLLDISLKIEGLKEIETTFLAEENLESIPKEEINYEIEEKEDDEKKVYIEGDIDISDKEKNVENIDKIVETIEELKMVENLVNRNEVIDPEENHEKNIEIIVGEKEDFEQELEEFELEEVIEEEEPESIEDYSHEAFFNEEIDIEQPKSLKKSLLKSVFSNRKISEEISWRLHCVKDEKSYEEIAGKYNLNLNKLISINNNENLEEGKLIFLPLD